MRFALLALGFAAAVGMTAAVACTSTDTSPSDPSGGGGSGIDAAAPDGLIDCGAAPGADAPFSKAALLDATAECAAWHACNFQNAAFTLRESVHDHAATPSDAAKLEAARDAWRSAMNEWSKMELFQFGPAANKVVDRYHGRGLRSFIHPWPDLDRCQVETQVVSKTYKQGWDLVFPSSRGLFALEYALFYPGTDTSCLSNSATAKTWETLSPEQRTADKNEYATTIADNVLSLALEIRSVWLPEGENFKAKLLSFDGYGSEQETLNVVAWSLFYAEKEIKDWKLGSLAKVQTAAPNPETPFALVEIENIRTNLQAFRRLFQGCGDDGTGVGFDDWLVASGNAPLANEILAALAGAEAAADAFPSFQDATEAQFVELYQAIKPLSDLLKTNLFGSASPLNLKLPASAASDTD